MSRPLLWAFQPRCLVTAGLQAHGPDLELCVNLKDATLEANSKLAVNLRDVRRGPQLVKGLFAAADPADPCVPGVGSKLLRMEIRVLQSFHRGGKGSEGDQRTHHRRPTGRGQRLRPGRSQRGRVAETIRKKGG